MRPQWSLRMSQLLAPNGVLICLEFPSYKAPSTGGPPWAVRPEVYIEHFKRPGEKVPYDAEGFVVQEEGVKENDYALERIAHWKAERTHAIGEGTDRVSLWRHKQKLQVGG
jgi:methyl halide transferase